VTARSASWPRGRAGPSQRECHRYSQAAKEAPTNIPILIVGANFDPVALKFAASLARPGTNVTGLFFLHLDLTAKRLALL